MSINSQVLLFEELGNRKVCADFSGGHLSSDGGLLLLRSIDHSLGLSRLLSQCFRDRRDERWVEHSLPQLIAQRVLGLAAGYEDLNDHNRLRLDPLMATAVGKDDPLGRDRVCAQDRGKPLAGASTLNRLELGTERDEGHYHKIHAQFDRIRDLLIGLGVRTLDKKSAEVVIDVDATDDPIHGGQQGRFYHGYYGNYCYLPLYMFIGSVPIWAELRTSDGDASRGVTEALEIIIPQIRRRCPRAKIILRADSGFCREEILSWCENQREKVYYCVGLARNARLEKELETTLYDARIRACLVGGATRGFRDFQYQTKKSWSCSRRVIGKAEVVRGGKNNPRFVVTNLPEEGFNATPTQRFDAQHCYEDFYCARGDMENRIKEQQLDLFADRTSTGCLGSNQLRLWFSTFAYFLVERLRAIGLKGTQLSKATAGTIRVRLFKVAASITVTTRRVYIQLASSFPMKEVFEKAQRQLAEFTASSG